MSCMHWLGGVINWVFPSFFADINWVWVEQIILGSNFLFEPRNFLSFWLIILPKFVSSMTEASGYSSKKRDQNKIKVRKRQVAHNIHCFFWPNFIKFPNLVDKAEKGGKKKKNPPIESTSPSLCCQLKNDTALHRW